MYLIKLASGVYYTRIAPLFFYKTPMTIQRKFASLCLPKRAVKRLNVTLG
ncbi:hypothetical protein ACUSRQ_000356 [Vibrio harveyi]